MSSSGRLSRLSNRDESPHDRYCRMCQRNIFHCKRCKHKCHKKCPGHSHKVMSPNKRAGSSNKIYAGDEHWTKILQTNEAEVPRCDRHCLPLHFLHSPLSATERDFIPFRYQPTTSISRTSSSVSSYPYRNNNRNTNVLNTNNNLIVKNSSMNSSNGCYTLNVKVMNSPGSKFNSGVVNSYASYSNGVSFSSTPLVPSPSQGSNPIFSANHSQSPKQKSLKPVEKQTTQQSVQNPTKEKNVFHSLVARFISWIDSSKQDQPNTQDAKQQTSNAGVLNKTESDNKTTDDVNINARSDIRNSPTAGCIGFSQTESLRYKKDQKRPRRRAKTIATSGNISSSDCDTTDSTLSIRHNHHFRPQTLWWQKNDRGPLLSTSTTCSSAMVSSCTSPTTSDCFLHDSAAEFSPCRRPTSFKYSLANPPGKQLKFRGEFGPENIGDQKSPQDMTSPSNMSTTTNSSSYGSLSSLSDQISPEKNFDVTKETLIDADLPQSARMRRAAYKSTQTKDEEGSFTSKNNKAWLSKDTLINSSLEKDSLDASDTMSLCSMFDNCDQYMKGTLEEWNIPITDLTVLDLIRSGLTFNIHRGRWHGNVFVYKFNVVSESRAANFLKEVTRLSKIRHENVCLFVGASVSPNTMAIVTSELKGMSIYDRIHLTNDRISSRLRLSISEQVAQAIGYLHAKKIVIKSVNTRNVYFDPKVKLSLLGHSSPQLKHPKPPDTACFSRGALSYLAPELLKKIRPAQNEWDYVDEKEYSMQSDTFAFGTFLYEVMSGQLATKNLTVDELMWKVARGVRPSIKHINANSLVKALIDQCWLDDPEKRPLFSEINSDFMNKGHMIY